MWRQSNGRNEKRIETTAHERQLCTLIKKSLTTEEHKKSCEAVNSMKEKSSGEIKGRTCANGSGQCDCIGKEEATNPAVSMESVLLTAEMEAKQHHKVQTCVTPNAFTQTTLDDIEEQIVLMLHGLAAELLCDMALLHKPLLEKERVQLILHSECRNVTCGMLKAALSFCKSFKTDMEAISFEINPHD